MTNAPQPSLIAIPRYSKCPPWLDPSDFVYSPDELSDNPKRADCALWFQQLYIWSDHWAAAPLLAGLEPWNAPLQGPGPPSNYAGGKVFCRDGAIVDLGPAMDWTWRKRPRAWDIIGFEPAQSASAPEVSPEAARGAGAKLNAFVSRALDDPQPQASGEQANGIESAEFKGWMLVRVKWGIQGFHGDFDMKDRERFTETVAKRIRKKARRPIYWRGSRCGARGSQRGYSIRCWIEATERKDQRQRGRIRNRAISSRRHPRSGR